MTEQNVVIYADAMVANLKITKKCTAVSNFELIHTMFGTDLPLFQPYIMVLSIKKILNYFPPVLPLKLMVLDSFIFEMGVLNTQL